MNEIDERFMKRAIELARTGMESTDGGPIGSVVVRNGEIIGEGSNRVTSNTDPTAHAEIVAIREACKAIGDFQLSGCTIYTSCEPCPMCLGAIYWARPSEIFYAGTREDAAQAGFDDELFYGELEKPNEQRQLRMISLLREDARAVFADWLKKTDKIEY
jgi:tRNA(Arg) A34 adenosine deaminase TadA